MKTAHALLIGCVMVAGCTTPDLGKDIEQTRTMLAATLKDVSPVLDPKVAAELARAEREAALAGERIISFPADCRSKIVAGAQADVSGCTVRAVAAPVDGPVNATQLRAAFQAMDGYFSSLEALANAKTADEIETNTKSLLDTLAGFPGASGLDQFAASFKTINQNAAAVGSVAGFVAEQQRLRALRRVMDKADGVLEDIVQTAQSAQAVSNHLSDEAGPKRADVITALTVYDTAHTSGSVAAQLQAAKDLRTAVDAMHKAEAKSPIRRLFLARQMHGAMLAKAKRAPDIEELGELATQISEINDLLEIGK